MNLTHCWSNIFNCILLIWADWQVCLWLWAVKWVTFATKVFRTSSQSTDVLFLAWVIAFRTLLYAAERHIKKITANSPGEKHFFVDVASCLLCYSWMNEEMLRITTLESIHLKWDCTDSICHKINMTFLQAAMSSLCFPQGKRRECTYVCERGCKSARNPRSCWLVTGPFPAPFVGGRLWSCREKTAHSICFEEGRGTWQGVAEAQCFVFF